MSDTNVAILIGCSVVYFFTAIGAGEWVRDRLSGLEVRPRNSLALLLGGLWPLTFLIVFAVGAYEGISGKRVDLRWLP